jgi:CheY-like chemotaxis protein
MFRERIQKTGISLVFDTEEGLPDSLIGDPLRLSQVFINIVGNSFKFTKEGSIVLKTRRLRPAPDSTGGPAPSTAAFRAAGLAIGTAASPAAFAAGASAQAASPSPSLPAGLIPPPGAQGAHEPFKALFTVTDTGIGMSQDQTGRLFKAFTQADTSITRQYGGTGLGLTITKRLVELMGGSITIESELGRGTTVSFTCIFEVDAEAEKKRKEEQSRRPSSKAPSKAKGKVAVDRELLGRRVLLVEDNEVNVLVARSLMQKMGLEVTVAENGEAALETLQGSGAKPFDVVLMDLQMPVMDGFEATRRIRENPEWGKLPIIAMTAHAFAEERDRCFQAGMNGHLSKPIDVALLTQTLKDVVAGRSVGFLGG